MNSLSCQDGTRQQYIEKFHPGLRSRFFISTKFKVFADRDDYSMTPPVPYRKSTLWRYGDFTHFTPNPFHYRTRTHAAENLAVVCYIPMDFDSDYQTCRVEIHRKCDELNIVRPAYMTRTRRDGVHAVWKLRFPVTNANHFDMVTELKNILINIFNADPCQPGLTMLIVVPATPMHLLYSEPSNQIDNIAEVLKSLRSVKQQATPVLRQTIARGRTAFEEGTRNNSLYTLLLLARDRGIDRDRAITDIERYYNVSVNQIDNYEHTVKSAFQGKRHAKNDRIKEYCLGRSAGDVCWRIGWSKPRARKTTDEDFARIRSANRDTYNKSRSEMIFTKIQNTVADLKDEGILISAKKISAITGIHMSTIAKYKRFIMEW